LKSVTEQKEAEKPKENAAPVTSSSGSTEDSNSNGNGKKKVRWARETELVQIQFFEVDDSERSKF